MPKAERVETSIPPASVTRTPLRPGPFESLEKRASIEPERPGFLVDLRRCIGCHACSVACKTAHETPLGEFPIRVRWLPRPDASTYAFLPVFSESLCKNDLESLSVGLAPACARACPTDALVFGDFAESESTVSRSTEEGLTRSLEDLPDRPGLDKSDLKKEVVYRGLEDWVANGLHRGASLDPRDQDPIYEQK